MDLSINIMPRFILFYMAKDVIYSMIYLIRQLFIGPLSHLMMQEGYG